MMLRFLNFFALCVITAIFAPQPFADELRPAALRLSALPSGESEIVWQVPMSNAGRRESLVLSLNGQPLNSDEGLAYRQGTYWISRQTLALGPRFNVQVDGLADNNTELLVSLTYPDGERETQRLQADNATLDVNWAGGSGLGVWAYIGLGVEHILIGADHLLFVAALMMLVTQTRMLIWTITSFTVAHSLTLAAASMGWLVLPVPPVEAVIALSIVFVAREVVMRERGRIDISSKHPWVVAFCFGLLHGLGFASVLADIGLPAESRLAALLMFNVGVELGQLLFVASMLALYHVLKRMLPMNWIKPILPSYVIGALAAYWVIDRTIWF